MIDIGNANGAEEQPYSRGTSIDAQAIEFVPDERQIVVTMNVRTASILLEILQHIGGNPMGPRGNMDRLREALDSVQILHPVRNLECGGTFMVEDNI